MLISFSVSGGDVRVRASPGARCETAPIKTTVPLTADGTFSAIGVSRATPGGGRRITTTYDIAGTIDGASASGTARGATSVATRGRATRRCTSGTVRWGARRATGELGAAGAVAKARLYGTTSQRLEGPRRAIVLRVSSDATKLTRALYDVTLTCGTRKRTDIYDAPRRNLTIEDDGTFADVERFDVPRPHDDPARRRALRRADRRCRRERHVLGRLAGHRPPQRQDDLDLSQRTRDVDGVDVRHARTLSGPTIALL